MLFVMFFLIKDGERIWSWLLGAMRTETARRWDRAGHAAWLAVVLPSPRRYERGRMTPYLLDRAATIYARMEAAQIP